MKRKGICQNCGKEFWYYESSNKGKFCSLACKYSKHSESIKESYTPQLKEKKRQLALKQMSDPEQRKIRSQKLKGRIMSEEHLQKNIESHPKKMCNSYRERALEHYGYVCQRCGQEFPESKLIVHHIDENNGGTDAGNHKLDNLMVLCRSCHTKLHHEIKLKNESFVGLPAFRHAAHYIFKGLEQMGLDISDVNFKNTPERVARAYFEIFQGVINTEKQVKDILSTSFPSEGMSSMITACGITAFSMCPHHLLPVEYKICVGYVPNEDGKVLGISKLSRLAQILAKRPVLQETLCKEITDALMSIGVQGAACAISGRHMCMRMRGVKDPQASVYTQYLQGCFMEKPACREEFLLLIKDGLKFD